MNRISQTQLVFWVSIFVFIRCAEPSETNPIVENNLFSELPFQVLPLNNLDSFHSSGSNWQVVRQVKSDFLEDTWISSTGEGVLINEQALGGSDLYTQFTHGDMELDIEFLIPRGSNSGIYFQSRYELQILDSWGVSQPTSSDCGGIYERWDEAKEEGKQGVLKVLPSGGS